jgi:hypothetical protein
MPAAVSRTRALDTAQPRCAAGESPIREKGADHMKILSLLCACALAGAGVTKVVQDMPKPAKVEKEHEWLKQLVGEWDMQFEMTAAPGQPAMPPSKGTESVRSFGEIWTIAECKSQMGDMPFTGLMTLGYDPVKKKFVGTWIDSTNAYMWSYLGTLDEAGKVLALEAEGPNPMAEGKTAKFRDAIEIKSKDQRVLTSSMLGDDGKWVSFMKVTYTRKK